MVLLVVSQLILTHNISIAQKSSKSHKKFFTLESISDNIGALKEWNTRSVDLYDFQNTGVSHSVSLKNLIHSNWFVIGTIHVGVIHD
jgi:hypothetical protein